VTADFRKQKITGFGVLPEAEFPVYPVKSCHAGVALLLFNRVYPVGIIILRGFPRWKFLRDLSGLGWLLFL